MFFLVSGVAAFLLRFDFNIPASEFPHLVLGIVVWLTVKSAAYRLLNLDRGWWRYISVHDVARLATANLGGSALSCLALICFTHNGFPRSVYMLDFLVCLGITAGARVTARLAFESRLQNTGKTKRTLIYGAGAAGVALLREIHQNPALPYKIVGFIDDDPTKTGGLIHGVKVFDRGTALPSIVPSQNI